LARSARWRDLLRPLGHHDELRITLADRGLCWGHLVCYRDLPGSSFTEDQEALMRRLVPLLGAHMREGWRRGTAGPRIEDEPGTLLFDASLTQLAATPAAPRWLKALGWPPTWGLPAFIYALGARAADTHYGVTIQIRALQAPPGSSDRETVGYEVTACPSITPVAIGQPASRAWS
jgi:hypothetical protein